MQTVTIGTRVRSGEDIREASARLAGVLADLGVGPSDAVALIAHNDFVVFETTLAAGQLDAYVVPINWHWQEAEAAHALNDSGAKVIIGHDTLLRTLAKILPPNAAILSVSDKDDAILDRAKDYRRLVSAHAPSSVTPSGLGSAMFYTSGTTGRPKAVRRLPANPEEMAQRRRVLAHVYQTRPDMRSLTTGPLYHLFPQATAMSTFRGDGSVVVMERFDPEGFLALVEKHRITHAQLVPTTFVRLLRLPEKTRTRYDLSSLETIFQSGAPCAPEVKRAMIAWFGPILWESYGSTETGVITQCSSIEWLERPGTVGRPVVSGEVRIYDPEGKRLPAGSTGGIYMRMHGTPDFTYHGQDEARRGIEREGFISVGDIGHLDEDGYLFVTDRSTDMLISGGVNVYPAEIEAALLTHPHVLDAAVFGIPDEEFGEVAAAHIEIEPGASVTSESIQTFLRERLAHYKVPRVIIFERALPRDPSGKLYKRALRERYWHGRQRRI